MRLTIKSNDQIGQIIFLFLSFNDMSEDRKEIARNLMFDLKLNRLTQLNVCEKIFEIHKEVVIKKGR